MIGQLLDRRYKIIQALSAGGFGHTYIAEDLRIPGKPKCVVKHLKPNSNDLQLLATAERLFWSEAESLAQLGNHDQIPRILDFLEENQEFFLVQELIEGQLLTDELIPGKKFSESYVLNLLQDVLPILEFIHQRDVIHRDIKPANIIRRQQDNKLVLIDFGAVKQVRDFGATIQDRRPTVLIGTPGYMSTEQGRGKPRANSDIYALGMVAIQALSGLEPCDLEEDLQTGEILWQQHVSVSPELAEVLGQMVRYHFKDRYQSAIEVLQALQQIENLSHTSTVEAIVKADITPTKYITQIQKTTQIQESAPQPLALTVQPSLALDVEPSPIPIPIVTPPPIPPVPYPSPVAVVSPSSGSVVSPSRKSPLMVGLGVVVGISAIAGLAVIILSQLDTQNSKNLKISFEEQLRSSQCRVVSPTKGETTAKVRAQPLRKAEITTTLDKGIQVVYLGEQGAFVEIQFADESKGWVYNDQIKPCNSTPQPSPTSSNSGDSFKKS